MLNPINDLPYIANLAKANINRVVKVTYTRSYRPNETKTVIASIRDVNEKFGFIEFGHPYDLEKEDTEAGTIGLLYNDDDIDIKFIRPEYFEKWMKNYIEFHNSIIKSGSCDTCSENIDLLKI